MTSQTDYEIIENEQSAHIIIPVTLAEVEQYPVTLNSRFGSDKAEHRVLLHDPNILRILAGVQVTDRWWSPAGGNVDRCIRLEAYSGRLFWGPRWHDCLHVRPHASAHKMESDQRTQEAYLWKLAEAKCPDLDDRLAALAEGYEDAVQEYIRANPDEYLAEAESDE